MRRDYEPKKSVPGLYTKLRADAAYLAGKYILEWEEKRMEIKEKPAGAIYPPTICFSRKIGVGALEIADLLASKLGYRVVDREILEHIATEAKLTEKTVALFDERYPGKLSEFLTLAFGEKAFIKSDYARHLFSAVFAIAALGPTIFVGRGAHLLLERDRVLAVRIICSKAYRVNRLAGILKIDEEEAEARLDKIDRQKRAFYKRVYGKKEAHPSEFDLVINCDFISKPEWVAEIIETAFMKKFGDELVGV
ncbi:MAG: AAA family ATPase [Desulfatiglandales bacterium]